MPRKSRRTMSGDAGAPAATPVDVPYGEGERAIESQRRTPVPVTKGQNLPAVPGGGGGGTSGAPADRMSEAIQMAQAMAPGDNLAQMPTGRPAEPLMTGAGSVQPGPTFDDGLMELRALARAYPYPDLLQLLSDAELEL